MGKNEQTSKDAAKKASDLLRKHPSPKVKSVAGSDLTQAPDRPKKKK